MMRNKKLVAAGVGVVLLVGAGLWLWSGHGLHAGSTAKPADPLQPAVDAYTAGKYRDAEAEAHRIIEATAGSKSLAERNRAVRARYVYAFSAARRKDLATARERFADLQHEAAKLPDKGRESAPPGMVAPTLEQDGAYQHAVCTAVLGDKEAAEAEYLKFMHDYPDSPLLRGAMMRIERIHNGHLPPEAKAAWDKAMRIAQARQEALRKAQEREQSMCGPECLAELLRRRGEKADVRTLAAEMKTSDQGTSLKALADASEKCGFSAKGLSLTQNGLLKQPLPLVALVAPGHYVLVDSATPKEVTMWDAYAQGPGRPGTRCCSTKEWSAMWSGMALVLEPKRLAQ